MELTDYIRILRKNWLIIVIATLLGVGVAAGCCAIYRSALGTGSASRVVSEFGRGSDARSLRG